MTNIHPTAVIEDGARLGADVSVGAFSFIGRDVTLGDGVVINNHVSVKAHTTIGDGTVISPFASLGGTPQSVHYKGEPGAIIIGKNCVIRENVTINIGSVGPRETRIGDRCFLMTGIHIAHDCTLGNDVIMANCATLGGHVSIGNNVFLGGLCALHQFVRVGDHAIVGGLCPVWHDVIPFGALREGIEGLGGLNIIGMKRRGFSRPAIQALRAAYRDLFFGPGQFAERLELVTERYGEDENVAHILEFIRQRGKRRITMPRHAAEHHDAEA
ncbi:acyl-ACP--UDP-N-acetylglucosamine O-acyltransferase [Kaistia dalseonensis]|uniref:UDP-N-acetylglucosamine acyltransferase n=1 Tax=Kaistia dalseonensis TaxID=410840 RepID=A0ABU0H114_9HYPH|nr:acyl-ACP--UDP-N-acetylglucosamine O-acyltransferase [Kaistia dalseonensis]MCX5493431.1 acyl-ACP--UDP-N-acetylglucosamine O-acyltransferase [Kaistia dalseonensis]MDQ0435990.1 UDP-N-acetylglucosamine acyltransferase [Kaistia dalseonensis]